MKKLLSVILVSLFFLGNLPSSFAFNDLSYSHFAFQSVQSLIERGVLQNKTKFKPSEAVSRAEFIHAVMKTKQAEEEAENEIQDHFDKNHWYADYTDVPVNAWYASAVAWAHSKNYISGKGDGKFYPYDNLNRAEAAKILTKIFLEDEILGGETSQFKDVNPAAWYYPYLISVVNSGLLNGYTNEYGAPLNLFGPNNQLTRGEMAVILERALYLDPATAFSKEDFLSFDVEAIDEDEIEVQFITAVNSSAFEIENYEIKSDRPKIKITDLEKKGTRTVVLKTSEQIPGKKYTLKVEKVRSKNTDRPLGDNTEKVFFGYSKKAAALAVSIADEFDTDRAALPKGANDVEFLRLKLKAEKADLVLNSLTLRYRGLNKNEEIKNLKVYLDGEEVEDRSRFSSNRTADFYFSPALVLEEDEEYEMSFIADLSGSPSFSSTHIFEITSNSDFDLSGGFAKGDFPLKGPEFKRYNITSGSLHYYYEELEDEIIELGEETDFASLVLEAHDEDIEIRKVIFRYSGNLKDEYFEDVELRIGSRRVGSRLDSADDGKFIFDFSDYPYTIEQNTAERMILSGEIEASTDSTISFYLDSKDGITASGEAFGFGASSRKIETSPDPSEREVENVALALRTAPDNPKGYTMWAGESRQTVAKFEVTAEGGEVQLENIRLKLITENFDHFRFEKVTAHWSGDEVGEFLPIGKDEEWLEIDEVLTVPKGRTKTLTVRVKILETFTDEEGSFQILWPALTSSGINFTTERTLDEESLERDEIYPEGEVILKGGLFKVKKSD